MFFRKRFLLLLFLVNLSVAQDVSLYQQINGRFDFTFIGNTMNPEENSFMVTPTILTSSSANLNLNATDEIEVAYLYWAGCGPGDFEVDLNGETIIPDRTFSVIQTSSGWSHFSAFKDVTNQVKTTGNGTYTLSNLDVSASINQYFGNRTNFAGWAMIIVFKNATLPLNQLNIYDGLQAVPSILSINLNSLNVIDNQDARIGFLAWEGDVGIAVNETLRINGTILSNLPLNPANNAFNGTNTVTNSNQLYNMDLDIYNIQNNIAIGDTQAVIEMTSDQDYVMINAIVTKLNSQLPDATIFQNSFISTCNSREVTLNYTVSNVNSTNDLQANTPIAFYINGILIGTAQTQNIIAIGGSETGTITLIIPDGIPTTFQIKAVVDDTGNGTGIVTEIDELNNSNLLTVNLLLPPTFTLLDPITSCNLGFTKGVFDFSNYENTVKVNPTDAVSFHETEFDAIANTNPILNTSNYEAVTTPTVIFVRIDDGICFAITQFTLATKNCPPIIYNGVSPNNDGLNDTFFIDGLRNVFSDYKIEIYNRWGKLVWTGDASKPDWDGYLENAITKDKAPEGTYFYILYLNDKDNLKPLTGYLFLTR